MWSGGPGWQAWMFTFAFAACLCLLVPLPLLPWAVTGRYWLTQRRLIWKPTWGAPKEILLRDITGVDAVIARATVRVKGTPKGFTLQLITGWQRLWGALILFRELPVPERLGTPRVAYQGLAVVKGEGGTRQSGYGVVHRDRFYFFPSESRHHLAADAAKLTGMLALALVGVAVHSQHADLPFDLWLSLWSHLSDEEFGALLSRTAQARGGLEAAVLQLEPVGERSTVFRLGEVELRMSAPLAGSVQH